MTDKILQMFFEPERWEYAIAKGVGKDIRKDQLYQLTKTDVRLAIYRAIRDGEYEIAPPHTAKIPKEEWDWVWNTETQKLEWTQKFRVVYINEPIDRIILSIANDLFFELMPHAVHKQCKSYLTGIGCGKVVQEISREIVEASSHVSPNYKGRTPKVGWKSDLSKYFDSVPIWFIDRAFDDIEALHGKSALIDVIRKYYHSDLYFDTDGNLQRTYQSLKQGCSVASYLADVLLYHIDEKLSNMNGKYVRYSDDTLYIGNDYKRAMQIMERELAKMKMHINEKKLEYIDNDHWFKFLGYSIKGSSISMSPTRLKTFQREIEVRTIRAKDVTLTKAVHAVNRYLYRGDGDHSWATQILPVVNVERDLLEMNNFIMDCLRAVTTGKKKVGGLGYAKDGHEGCVVRGMGSNVKSNRSKVQGNINGYLTLHCMQNAILTSRPLYETLMRQVS